MAINVSGGLTNSGTLMHVSGGTFSNFSGSTLTGGTYNTAGTLKIDQLGSTGGEIVTNAANIVLNGADSSFVDSASKDALSSFATNATAGTFSLFGGRNFTTSGGFANSSEHYTITYETGDVLLTVASGPVAAGATNLHARLANADRIARTISEQIDYGSRVRSLIPSLQPIAAAPTARFSSSGFHVETASRFASASIGAKLNAAMADHFAPAAVAHSLSVKPSASAPAHTNFAGPARPGGKVIRGNLQFSLPSLFSKPHVDLTVN
jgi:hypothetical protein